MLIREIINELTPSEDEVKAIQQDKELKKKPKARNMTAVATGGQSTYPFM